MKKLLAIALTALMMVCAVAPAFAADDALPAAFEDAAYINLGEIYTDVNTAAEGAFAAGTALYHFHAGDFNKWGIANMQGVMPFSGVEYPVEFEVEDDGKYAFCVSVANYKTPGNVTVKIYNEAGDLLATEVLAPSADMTEGQMVYFTLAAELDLAADECYTATFSGAKESGATGNSIVCNFYYASESAGAAEDTSADATEDTSADAGEDTSADAADDTSADAGEDTSADDATGDDVAPETFDVAVIALAVAGASAAVAVVSKKRR